MSLPPALQQAIDSYCRDVPIPDIRNAVRRMSESYRTHDGTASTLGKADIAAYLLTRLPATFAATQHVLRQAHGTVDTRGGVRILDAGCGPGTGLAAALSTFSTLNEATLMDSSAQMLECAEELFAGWHAATLKLQNQRLETASLEGNYDVVLCSYSLNELPDEQRAATVERLWTATSQKLVIVEPGTPVGFGNIRRMREQLIAAGAFIEAPCTHGLACPLAGNRPTDTAEGSPGWCHFPVRVERTKLHRLLKEGSLGYEDEKISYLIAAKSPFGDKKWRIIDKPEVSKITVTAWACGKDGMMQISIPKRDRAAYKQARKWRWGDFLPEDKAEPS